MVLAQAAITEATTVTISLKVLGTMLGLASSVIGVYVASLRRDDRLASRIDDLEQWHKETWRGPGGHKQTLDSLRRWQLESRGERRARRDSSNHKVTRGPGESTIT